MAFIRSDSVLDVVRLYCRYAELVDGGDFAGVGRLFCRGTLAVADTSIEASGSAAVQAVYEQWIRRYPETGTPRTKHVVTNLDVDIDDTAGTATGRSYVTVFQHTSTLPLQLIMVGGYEDRFRAEGGVWGFEHRVIRIDLWGDLSQHLLQDLRE